MSVPTIVVALVEFVGGVAIVRREVSAATIRVHIRNARVVILRRREFDIGARRRPVVKYDLLPGSVSPIVLQHLFRKPLAKLHIESRTFSETPADILAPEAGGVGARVRENFKSQGTLTRSSGRTREGTVQ